MTKIEPEKMHPMRRIKNVHMVGIGGAGMCGIAEVLSHLHYQVSGSDIADSPVVQRLREIGVIVKIGHQAAHIEGADVVVVSSAIRDDNPEVFHAKALGIPVVPRAEMLAELMRFKEGIAIAGTHGKTTTTSLVSHVFDKAGLDPTYVIGGKLNQSKSNARLGQGPYLVVEADESDASFLLLKPLVSVVTNIESDHMETYSRDFSKLKATFLEFVHHLPFYGLCVACIDDVTVRELLPNINRTTITYGIDDPADVMAKDISYRGLKTEFTLVVPHQEIAEKLQLNLAGRHNVLNALAAIAVALEHDVPLTTIKDALLSFPGVGRRLERKGTIRIKSNEYELFDDYGHHPSEMVATVAALRAAYPHLPLAMIFQPHRYSRTEEHFDSFVKVLSEVDYAMVLDIYSAGEKPIEGISSQMLCDAATKSVHYIGAVDNLAGIIEGLESVPNHAIVVTQGAGDVSKIAQTLSTYSVVAL